MQHARFFAGFAVDLCTAMSEGYEDQRLRVVQLHGLLSAFFGEHFDVHMAAEGGCRADLMVASRRMRDRPLVLVVVENEQGAGGDTWLQCHTHYEQVRSNQQACMLVEASCQPACW